MLPGPALLRTSSKSADQIVTKLGLIIFFHQLNRLITVRELARAQGFPDDYQFYSKDKDVRDVCALYPCRDVSSVDFTECSHFL